jgi:hypothetical protein
MSDILNGIGSYCGEMNLPGVKILEYLPVDWIADGEYEEFITTAGNFQKAITPSLGGAEWLKLPFFPKNGDGWEERGRKIDQGDEYAQSISGLITKLRPEVSAELDRMAKHRFLCRLTDKNGKRWLVGRLWEPLTFTASADAGRSTGGLNSYSFSFEGVTTKRAFGYSPVF